jgi:methylmalonyl-CoA/ethylmalonyl-CoA epimerase
MRISHLGVAVKDLGLSEELFARLLGEKKVHHEEVANQSVRIASIPVGDGLIELTEASNPDSAIAKFIGKRGEGIHHIAFEVDDIVSELARVKAAGFQLIDEVPRMGAHGMLVAFLHPKSTNGVLVELCQSVNPHAGNK